MRSTSRSSAWSTGSTGWATPISGLWSSSRTYLLSPRAHCASEGVEDPTTPETRCAPSRSLGSLRSVISRRLE
jgi:hypothetical protein